MKQGLARLFIPITFLLILSLRNVGVAADLVLSGSQVLVIENTTYSVSGNIYVRDNAKLILRNATLILNISYHEEFMIWVTDGGTIEVINSNIKTSLLDEVVVIYFLDKSNLSVQNSDLHKGRVYISFGLINSDRKFTGNVSILNSKLWDLSLFFSPLGAGKIYLSGSECATLTFRFYDDYKGEFCNLKPGLFALWVYNNANYDIRIENTVFSRITVGCDGAQITVRDSEIFQFGTTSSACKMIAINSKLQQVHLHSLQNITASIKNLKIGFFDNWRLSNNATGGPLPEFIFENTEIIDRWSVNAFGANISVDNSVLDIRSYLGPFSIPNNFNITNSTVMELMFYQCADSIINFDNTSLGAINVLVPPVSATITGNLTFLSGSEIRNWFSPSTLKRLYSVIALDQAGNPLPGASLFLYSKTSALIWSGETDNTGQASFEIQFKDDNYSDAMNLILTFNGTTISKAVSLLSSTPIELKISQQNQGPSGGGGCFIATATYGSSLAPQVQVLREFKNRHLLTNKIGIFLVKGYWVISPTIAVFINKNKTAKILFKFFLTPVVYMVKYPRVLTIIIIAVGIAFFYKKLKKSKIKVVQREKNVT